jgi:hypothetical protein
MDVDRADVNISEVSGSTIVQASHHSTRFAATHRTAAGSDFIVMNITAFLPILVVVLACCRWCSCRSSAWTYSGALIPAATSTFGAVVPGIGTI